MLYPDDREPLQIIHQIKQSIEDIEVKRLDVADYVMGSEIAVERKELCDLLGSVYDGRYWTQIRTLKDTYPFPIVLVEGDPLNTYRNIKKDRKVYKSLLNDSDVKMIRTLENGTLLGWRIPFIQTLDMYDSADRIVELYNRFSGKEKGEKPRAAVRKAVKPEEVRNLMLQNIEGIGGVLSERILERYSFSDLISLQDSSVLCKSIDGLRDTVAKRILDVL